MHICFKSQRLIGQLNWIYDTITEGQALTDVSVSYYALHDFLYDFLIDKGHDMSFDPKIKAELWRLAIESFKTNEKKDPTEKDTEKLHKYYKSFLVKKYLIDKLPERLFLYDENNQQITRIDLKVK